VAAVTVLVAVLGALALLELALLWRQSSTILGQRRQIAAMVQQLADVNDLMAKVQRQKIPGVRSVGEPP
jgi:hypothetical protein